MALGVMAVMTKGISGIMHMTKADGSRGSVSDDKRDQWHMHKTVK